MRINFRIALSAAGILLAAGAVVGGVALAQPSSNTPHNSPATVTPAAVLTTSDAPASSIPAAPSTTPAAVVPPSKHVVVRPKGNAVTTSSEPTSNVPVAGPSDAPKPTLPPMPPAPSKPAIELPPVAATTSAPSGD